MVSFLTFVVRAAAGRDSRGGVSDRPALPSVPGVGGVGTHEWPGRTRHAERRSGHRGTRSCLTKASYGPAGSPLPVQLGSTWTRLRRGDCSPVSPSSPRGRPIYPCCRVVFHQHR